MNENRYRNPLSRHILIGCLVFIILLCFIMGIISYVIFNRTMMSHYKGHLTDIINLTISRIDIDDLEQCIETGVASEKYWVLEEFLDDARQQFHVEYIALVTPVRTERGYDVMAVGSGLLPDERAGVNHKDMEIPKLGDMIGAFYPPEFIPIIYDDLLNRTTIKFSSSHTEFGRTYDGAIPVRNKDGKGILLLTTGMTLRNIDTMLHSYLLLILLCALVLSAVFITFMLMWLQKRVIIPLKKIERTAGNFAEKSQNQRNPEALILEQPGIRTGDELEALADTLVAMSRNMKEYVEAILTYSAEMADMKLNVTNMSTIAFRDSLTGVKNKASYDKEKERLNWDIINRMAKFALLMVDINYLKRVNDSYGHEKGDIYIKTLCKLVCDIFAHSPVYRVGGDEFLVILENRDYECAQDLQKKMQEKIETLQADKSLNPWNRVSAASGLAFFDSESDENVDDVFKRADKAMYQNKKEMKAVRTD